MLETTLVALQDIALEKIFDDHGRKILCSEFPLIIQQVCIFYLNRPIIYSTSTRFVIEWHLWAYILLIGALKKELETFSNLFVLYIDPSSFFFGRVLHAFKAVFVSQAWGDLFHMKE